MPAVYACILPEGAVATSTADAIAHVAEEIAGHKPDLALIVRSGAGSRIEIDDDRLAEQATTAGVPITTRPGDAAAPPEALMPALADADIVTVTTSRLALREHFELGRALGRAVAQDDRRVAIVCLATLSHALDQLARGYDPAGRLFDEQYRRAIDDWNVKWLVNLDARFRTSTNEHAAPQTAIVMGALAECRVQPQPLSYEVTSGVGHLVAAVDVLGPRRTRAKAATGAAEEE